MITYDEVKSKYPSCEFCGYPVIPDEDYSEVRRHFRYLEDCNGFEYMQPDPFAQEIYNDHTLVLMCDGQASRSAMDI